MEKNLSRAFTVEAARREINACEDIEKLRALTINLVEQTEALRGICRELLLRG